VQVIYSFSVHLKVLPATLIQIISRVWRQHRRTYFWKNYITKPF